MNDGYACLTIEDPKSAAFHADVRGLCDALGESSEPPPSSGRSEAATQPCTDPFADTLASPESFTSARPDWCVDCGPRLLTMTTFALWEALERGEVLAYMRVWREGMECWTAVGEIPEFAWAIAGTPEPPAEPEALPESEPPAEARTGPLHAPTVTVEPPPESSIRLVAPPVGGPWGGARWVALGSAVAFAALVSAIVVHRDPPPAPPAEIAGAAPPLETAPPSRPVEDMPAPEPPHHDEHGQRRLPRAGGKGPSPIVTGRRAYGR